jgi:uncharacterized protein with NAD-binding domain and iron-sulfur cluster
VVGAGVAGLTAAQELAERGFAVTVFERRASTEAEYWAIGGKSRSAITKNGFHGEHGFRYFPSFYRHLPDTLSRIPADRSAPRTSVRDRLVPSDAKVLASAGRAPVEFSARVPRTFWQLGQAVALARYAFEAGLDPAELAFYFRRLWRVLTSCPERRLEELEGASWSAFTDERSRSTAYRDFLAGGVIRNFLAVPSEEASARIVGEISAQLWLPLLYPNPHPWSSSTDRILDGPTQQTWFRPWYAYLRSLGVSIVSGHRLTSIGMSDGLVRSLTVESGEGASRFEDFDYCVAALPVEQLATVLSPEMCQVDAALGGVPLLMDDLSWMCGIQFYLTDVPRLSSGHVNFVASPWALTAILQSESWAEEFRPRGGRGGARAILSVCISNWEAPGSAGKSARECGPAEIAAEVWAQMKSGLNRAGNVVLHEGLLAGFDGAMTSDDAPWFHLDPILRHERIEGSRWVNAEPLLVNRVGSWRNRPEASTAIPNLVLAGDYVRTHTGLACMEGANEAGRRAVNAIIERSGADCDLCSVWPLVEPRVCAPLVERDRWRCANGLSWEESPNPLAPVELLTNFFFGREAVGK